MVNPPIEKTGTLAVCIITNRASSRQIIDNDSRQRYLAIRGIQLLSCPCEPVRSPRTPLPAAAIDPMDAVGPPFDDY